MGRHKDPEVQKRIEEVGVMLLDGAEPCDVVRAASERWGLHERQAREYLAQARRLVGEEARESGKLVECIGWALHAYHTIYQRCMETKNYAVARACVTDVVGLCGASSPIKVEVARPGNGSMDEDYSQKSDAELWAIHAKAEAALRASSTITPEVSGEREQPH